MGFATALVNGKAEKARTRLLAKSLNVGRRGSLWLIVTGGELRKPRGAACALSAAGPARLRAFSSGWRLIIGARFIHSSERNAPSRVTDVEGGSRPLGGDCDFHSPLAVRRPAPTFRRVRYYALVTNAPSPLRSPGCPPSLITA